MNRRGVSLWCAGLGWCLVLGCDQELSFPSGPTAEAEAAGAPATSGITGAGGDGDTRETACPGRLPLPDGPLHTTFGGAGGEGGQAAADEGQGSGGERAHGSGAMGEGGTVSSEGRGGAAGSEAGGAADGEIPAGPRVLLFSEYLEGTGSLKALEIYSVGAASLEGCELRTYFNGKLEPAHLALHGTLPAGGVQVLCSSALATAQPSVCDRSTNLTFNGDDALALACDGVMLDVFGQVGSDPGDSWADATMDHTLRRHCEVEQGRLEPSAPFDPKAQWLVLGPDIFDDLGLHGCYGE